MPRTSPQGRQREGVTTDRAWANREFREADKALISDRDEYLRRFATIAADECSNIDGVLVPDCR